MHLVDFDLSALISVAIHPIQLILHFTAIHLRKLICGMENNATIHRRTNYQMC